jgi:hypothetical protein
MRLDYRTKIELTAIIIAFGVIIITIVLSALDKIQLGGDLSNAFTITAEVGIGLFIAIAVFFIQSISKIRPKIFCQV